MKHLVLIYGLSGSGKSTCARILEDAGVRVLQNMPALLLGDSFSELSKREPSEKIVAVFGELASQEDVRNMISCAETLAREKTRVTEIFLDAHEDTLLNRYKESRRPHPFSNSGLILDAIRFENALLEPLRLRSHYVIATDALDVAKLAKILLNKIDVSSDAKLVVTFLSFGFKHGLPRELDLCFDVRFLKNPYFVETLKPMSGEQEPVRNFVLELDEAKIFIAKVTDLLDFLLPLYIREGKSYLTVGIGCTGGRHRSVAIAGQLSKAIKHDGTRVSVVHRDVEK